MKNTFPTFFRPALALAFSGLLLASCESKDKAPPAVPTGPGTNAYVINEGAFGKSTASVTLFDKTTAKVTAPTIFQTTNGRALGDVAQSMTVYNSTGYLVVNNSNKLEVVSLPDFKSTATISSLVQPRYLATAGTKGYVTEWLSATAGRVSVINLATNTIATTIATGLNPEKPLSFNNLVYVPNSGENTVSVIDATQDKVTSTITVSDGPGGLVADKSGNIWVLCGGITKYDPATFAVISSTPGALIRFSPGAPTQQLVLPFAVTSSPSKLRISPAGDQLYYTQGGGEYRMDITATSLPAKALINRRRGFYGFDIDPKDNTIYGCDASFSGASQTLRYRTDGTTIDSFATGTGSNGVTFY